MAETSLPNLELISSDFEEVFKDKFDDDLKKIIGSYEFIYLPTSKDEYDGWIKKIHETLESPWIVRAGEHRLEQWESGWSENLKELEEKKDKSALIPRYFGKYKVVRWKQGFITPLSPDFEYNTLAVIQDWLFAKYLRSVDAIYEFGCGTGHNLLRARRANPRAKLYGLDWTKSSEDVIRRAVEFGILNNTESARFNFFSPDTSFALRENSGIYTVASLEQVGGMFVPFVDYLLAQKPKVCVHIEPIAELLDLGNSLDSLSIEYFKKRNYLAGFLDYLKGLEQEGRIVIHRAQRTYIGSLFIEGYSVVVWSPR